MNPTVSATVAIVISFCSRMIVSKPRTPATTIKAAVARNAITLVRSPLPQPICSKIVAVASVESATSTVSQPTRIR